MTCILGVYFKAYVHMLLDNSDDINKEWNF